MKESKGSNRFVTFISAGIIITTANNAGVLFGAFEARLSLILGQNR